ncbi:hypothetical protein F750_0242 [Streptomyces sp. PAMC 26508]|uniref:hypothetical protein n=1 Tax=Streptomyces sp. PAMC 26508 TaxID=1265601 RepID=UPI0002C6CA41|nr:hypothetical protein [Streptomyces sp. PAMC 26508]AGJ52753.1 hypothetical protein F750_0242 [Streptomyces sp. PAMC 26508]
MASPYGPPAAPQEPASEVGWSDRVLELAAWLDGILAGLHGLDLEGVAPSSAYSAAGTQAGATDAVL